ncbi:MAG TPA: hypothetical protein VEC14_02825, partial [Reyranellaceae bacterium]|nr:hypothetical protein [Reyranellaceae bacterium]
VNNWIVSLAALAVVLAGAFALPSAVWMLGLVALLGLAGVLMLQGNRWRTGSLLIAALALGLVLVDLVAGVFAPRAASEGLLQVHEPADWTVSDPELGYAAKPNTIVRHSASFAGKPVYRVTYTIDQHGARATPTAAAGADTYLFLGDSFVFGEGLEDDQSLAAQFARARGFKVRTANLAFSGYGPNHLVRAFETGRYDRYADGKVKAVVTWIIPDHLRRVTGDASWLAYSPRYVLEDGKLRHTGTFNAHRWRNPLDGLLYLAGEQLAFVRAIGARQRQERQAELLVALLRRLQALARERLAAPLFVLYVGPRTPITERVLAELRQGGIEVMDVVEVTGGIPGDQLVIPHDGHPNAYQISLIATELSRRLAP